MMKNILSTFGEYTQRIENNEYEHYVFDYFVKKTLNNTDFKTTINDYRITTDEKIEQYNEIAGGNIRIYLLIENKKRHPNKVMIIYNHYPMFPYMPKNIIEYMKELYPDYNNIIYLAHTLATPGGLSKYEGTQTIKENNGKICKIIVKEAEEFSFMDVNEFVSEDGCC